MTEEPTQAEFDKAVKLRGEEYRETRDRILSLEEPSRSSMQKTLGRAAADPGDWRRALTAEILTAWLTDRETVLRCDRYAAGDIPRPAPMAGFTVGIRAEAISEIGPAAVPRILERLWKIGEPDGTERSALFQALPKLGDLRAVPPMIELVTDGGAEADVRGSAASVLSQLGDARGIGPVLDLASDPDVETSLRQTAIRGVGRFRTSKSSNALVAILTRGSAPIDERRAAADGLRWAADPGTGPKIATRLAIEKDPRIRLTLIQTLGDIGTEAEVPALEQAAATSPDLKSKVDDAIEEIRDR